MASEICRHGLTPFESNELSSTADVVSPEEVRARIEVVVRRFLATLISHRPRIMPLSMVRRNCSNVLMQRGLLQGDNIFLSHLDSTLSFTKSGSMKRYFRVWKMLELCYQLLTLGKKATQREIFYRLLCDASEYFQCQEQVNKTIQGIV
ncbi:meiotic recombination protein SPO11-2 [Selaginella moellendorffii]|uniref:meiotic recombination protein SPO11-2 n=1 Tax=Selaginella moellendorffii TaxID=88036 RepID=UPI000D1C3203|nr:meiotic recombination protein SPO11-2 [Selaginella moellendorffii]|eukprot:XP_024523836.1 meiotic recombination protein SPO11-2 [Selaginella moellendorffii]